MIILLIFIYSYENETKASKSAFSHESEYVKITMNFMFVTLYLS